MDVSILIALARHIASSVSGGLSHLALACGMNVKTVARILSSGQIPQTRIPAMVNGVRRMLGFDDCCQTIESITKKHAEWLPLVASVPVELGELKSHTERLKTRPGPKLLLEGAAFESLFSPSILSVSEDEHTGPDATAEYTLILNNDTLAVERKRAQLRGPSAVDAWNCCLEHYLDSVRCGRRQVVVTNLSSCVLLRRIRSLFAVGGNDIIFSFDTDRATYRLDRTASSAAAHACDLLVLALVSILEANFERQTMMKTLEPFLLPGNFWRD